MTPFHVVIRRFKTSSFLLMNHFWLPLNLNEIVGLSTGKAEALFGLLWSESEADVMAGFRMLRSVAPEVLPKGETDSSKYGPGSDGAGSSLSPQQSGKWRRVDRGVRLVAPHHMPLGCHVPDLVVETVSGMVVDFVSPGRRRSDRDRDREMAYAIVALAEGELSLIPFSELTHGLRWH